MGVKQKILGTVLGRVAISLRSNAALINVALRRPEALACFMNDRLAGQLLTRLPCTTFLDVGAHIGSIVSEVQHATGARVIAVEAMPDKVEALRRKFPGLVVHGCAVGETTGQVSFFVVPNQSGYSSLIKQTDRESTEISVPLRRLDDIVNEPVQMIKIDVEGAELGVLRGAEALIAASRPVIMFESAPPQDMYSKAAMWEWFQQHDYQLWTPDRVAHDAPPLSLDGFEESHFYPRRTTNYFGIPNEKRGQVRDAARRLLGVSQPASANPSASQVAA
jgi:FkbM family methyltransferase